MENWEFGLSRKSMRTEEPSRFIEPLFMNLFSALNVAMVPLSALSRLYCAL